MPNAIDELKIAYFNLSRQLYRLNMEGQISDTLLPQLQYCVYMHVSREIIKLEEGK